MARQVTMTLHAVVVHRSTTATRQTGGLPQTNQPRPPRPCSRRRRIIIGISVLIVAGATIGTVVLLTAPGPQGNSSYVAVSPDGKLIVSASNRTDSVYIWDAASKRLIATLADPQRANDSVNAIAVSPDGTMIAVAQANAVRIWNIATGRVVATITAAAGALGVAFSPDGKTLAICNGNVLLWDVSGRRVGATLTTVNNSADGNALYAAFSPDGRTLAVSIYDNTDQNNNYLAPGIELWDVATRRVTANLKGGTGGGPIAYSRDGRALAATESTIYGAHFSLWDVTGKPRLTGEHSLDGGGMPIGYRINGPLAFSPDGATLAIVNNWPAKGAYLFDVATGQMTMPFTDPDSLAVSDLAYTPDGGTLITADGNGNIYLWNLGTRQVTATLTIPNQ
jgi:WD40 repeat protein